MTTFERATSIPVRENIALLSREPSQAMSEDVGSYSLDHFQPQNMDVKYETIKEIGDGLHAQIFLANKIQNGQNMPVCLKVFKLDSPDENLKVAAEEEFRVSQILKGHPNIINIQAFER